MKTRSKRLIACGGILISSNKQDDGTTIESYQFSKERGSTARAIMHGLLDLSRLGLSEIIGTPIEANNNNPGCFSIVATVDQNGNVTKMQL